MLLLIYCSKVGVVVYLCCCLQNNYIMYVNNYYIVPYGWPIPVAVFFRHAIRCLSLAAEEFAE